MTRPIPDSACKEQIYVQQMQTTDSESTNPAFSQFFLKIYLLSFQIADFKKVTKDIQDSYIQDWLLASDEHEYNAGKNQQSVTRDES